MYEFQSKILRKKSLVGVLLPFQLVRGRYFSYKEPFTETFASALLGSNYFGSHNDLSLIYVLNSLLNIFCHPHN